MSFHYVVTITCLTDKNSHDRQQFILCKSVFIGDILILYILLPLCVKRKLIDVYSVQSYIIENHNVCV